ncbi:MAG: aminopeptidase P family protein [Desulfobacteraceae bacterium]|jgi:Xaa-Pro aminopeptidase|nr:aminopeptidase P family protein [Desulfobacteraceae bacterium]
MKSIYAERTDRTTEKLPQHDIDTLMVVVGENRRYLSGFTGEDTQFDETAGALFITRDRRILATDTRYALQAETEAPEYEIRCYRDSLSRETPEILRDLGTQRLGYESVRLSCWMLDRLQKALAEAAWETELRGVEDLVESQRAVKTEEEIRSTRQALDIAEQAFCETAAGLREGMTERQLAWEMERRMREKGADSLSFPVIVAAGANSALPHAVPGDRPVRRGEPILFDWGARWGGYCSDTSRTLVLGEPDDTFVSVFQTVRKAQREAIAAIRPGASTRAVDAVARDCIGDAGFAGKFGHGLGHGTGLAIHEAPRLSPLRETTLAAGMVVTVEPGVYLPDWGGIRLENQVVVRPDGAEILTRLPVDWNPGAFR